MIPDSFIFPLAIVILFFYGFTLAPTYYLPPSVFSNEFGGKHCGLLVGLVDAAAFFASMLYLFAGGRMVVTWGWQRVRWSKCDSVLLRIHTCSNVLSDTERVF